MAEARPPGSRCGRRSPRRVGERCSRLGPISRLLHEAEAAFKEALGRWREAEDWLRQVMKAYGYIKQ